MEYFFHGTGEGDEALNTMIEIIESGGIKSKNKRHEDYYTLFNGDDYVSVAKWCYEEMPGYFAGLESSFYGWIFNMPCFIIDGDIEAIHATRVERPYSFDHNKDRVSQFIDEWHVKDEIPLDKIVGIALPFSWIRKSRTSLLKMLNILQYAKDFNWQVYNSDMNLIESVTNEECIYGTRRLEKRIQQTAK